MLETFLRYTSQPGWRAFTKEALLWSFGFWSAFPVSIGVDGGKPQDPLSHSFCYLLCYLSRYTTHIFMRYLP